MAQKKKLRTGDVWSIDLKDGFFGFGVVTEFEDVAFFELFSEDGNVVADSLQDATLLFRVHIHSSAFSSEGWKLIGSVVPKGTLTTRSRYWNQPFGSNELSIFHNGSFVSATEEEIAGLEQTAIWFDRHIEERLRGRRIGIPAPIEVRLTTPVRWDTATGKRLN